MWIAFFLSCMTFPYLPECLFFLNVRDLIHGCNICGKCLFMFKILQRIFTLIKRRGPDSKSSPKLICVLIIVLYRQAFIIKQYILKAYEGLLKTEGLIAKFLIRFSSLALKTTEAIFICLSVLIERDKTKRGT